MRILIADDDPVSRRILEDAVNRNGHDVTVVNDGVQAWERIESEPFDIVISDWVMPNMDGLELCRLIREREGVPFCHVMLVTNRDATEDVIEGIMAGANDFLTKPCDRGVLVARLNAAKRVVELERSLAARITELESALDEIKTLRHLLPICVYCKSIRDDERAWADIEVYMRENAQTDFTHSICPTCYDGRVRPMMEEMRREKEAG